MPKIMYEQKRFSDATLAVIYQANVILEEYEEQGYDLTLRQLYYQFVSRGFIANKQSEYDRLGTIVNNGRMAGLIDWDYIVDRTRNLRGMFVYHRKGPADALVETAKLFRLDKWADQDYRLEVWIEKDALVGVIQGVCQELDVPYFSCRGYTSSSEMWAASQRFLGYFREGKKVRILHLGDHDPSGIDMTRDVEDRLWTFCAVDWLREKTDDWFIDGEKDEEKMRAVVLEANERIGVDRLALNMDQVREYDPPPNPAKMSDARAKSYVSKFGSESWELDALPPDVLGGLIETGVEGYRNDERWFAALEKEREYTETLRNASERWDDVSDFLNGE